MAVLLLIYILNELTGINGYVINLHFSSSHPCSLEKDFTCHTEEMKSWFLNKGYPKWLINQEKGKVNFFNSIVSRRVKTNF